MGNTQPLKIQQKWEDMAQYMYVVLRHIPKSERFTLGAEIRASIWRGLRIIIRANNTRKNRMHYLYELDAEIKVLQGLLRTGRALGIIAHRKYENASLLLVELGRMLGGWIKHVRQ
ncbi:MAG: diversity-generating retroelement protein Avd [Desulfosudaceae bacterium]